MKFKSLYLSFFYRYIQFNKKYLNLLIKDTRIRQAIIFFILVICIFTVTTVFQSLHKKQLKQSFFILTSQINELSYLLNIQKQQSRISPFEASITAAGAYVPPLSEEMCLRKLSAVFLQQNRPEISVALLKQHLKATYMIQALELNFKSSFDYELFGMMEYISTNGRYFGYTRLREFEIEQLFETSPAIKGRFVYEQLSFKP